MQKFVFSIALFFVQLGIYAQSKQDSVAIIRLLEKEGNTWRTGDIKAHADCWADRPNGRILMSMADGRNIDVSPSVVINPSANMVGGGGFSIHSNYKMSVSTHTAWVSHDEVSIAKDGKETLSREVRLLEKRFF